MNKKGFTLVEVIVVIAILALLILVLIPNVFVILEKNKEKSCNSLVGNIENAAKIYVTNDKYNLNFECNTSVLISLQQLIDSGNLKTDNTNEIKNPIDNRIIDVTNEFVAVIYDCSTKTFIYEIPQINCEPEKTENKNISPWIMISEPKGDINNPTQTNDGTITVLGSVYDENIEELKLTINDEIIELTNKYSFKKNITLLPNETTEIIIKAIDASGNETIEKRYVYYNEKNINQAIYTEDGSLTFINDKRKKEGDILNGSKIIEVFTDFENKQYNPDDKPLWLKYNENITKVSFETEIAPKSTSSWFYHMKNLNQINNISNLNTENVTTMSQMFTGCSSLTELDISSLNTSNVRYMYDMFRNCTQLTTIILGENFNTSNVKNISSMFELCENLSEIITYKGEIKYINKILFDTSSVVSMEKMFGGCSSIKELDLKSFNTGQVSLMFSMFEGCTSLTEIDLSNFNTKNVTNMNHMFSNCTQLKKIILGENFDTTNVTTMQDMFKNCESLSEIITYKDGSEFINKLFFNTSNVTNMNYMFYRCFALESLDLRDFDTNKLVQTEYMFRGCTNLKTLDISNFNLTKLLHYESMFPQKKPTLEIYVNSDTKNWIEKNFTDLKDNIKVVN